jgi:type IX secretion system PorP/SprF family membrane protein
MKILLKIELIIIDKFRFKYLTSTIILFFLINQLILSQQQPLYSQFDNNRYLFNPAAAGAETVTTIHVNAYEQWVGFKGAPKYHTASIDSKIFNENRKPRREIRKKLKILLPENVGFGAQLFNEKYGPLSQSGLVGTYAYHLKMQDKQLSFGLSTVLSNFGLKSSDVVLSDDDPDQLVEGNNSRRWIFDFDFGIYFSGINYFAGYSIHHISESGLQWGGSIDADYQLGRIHYIMGGYKYEISPDIALQPSTLLKLSEKQKSQLDINLKCIISRFYWAGLSYKTSKTASIFAGLQYDRYIFCYSFDYTLGRIRKYSYGSHEIHLAVRLGNDTSRYKWLNKY